MQPPRAILMRLLLLMGQRAKWQHAHTVKSLAQGIIELHRRGLRTESQHHAARALSICGKTGTIAYMIAKCRLLNEGGHIHVRLA